jgi:hypothetical protein
MKNNIPLKKTQGFYQKNPIEKDNEQKISNSFFDKFFGSDTNIQDYSQNSEQYSSNLYNQAKKEKLPQRLEFTVFKHEDYNEKHVIPNEINYLIKEIRKEIIIIKNSNKTLINQIDDIEKTTLQSLPDKPGIYHIRFLELLLSFLKVLKAKVGEAKTWLAAMQSKKKKRGSLFMVLSKKKGTQYSLSQELQSTRAIM